MLAQIDQQLADCSGFVSCLRLPPPVPLIAPWLFLAAVRTCVILAWLNDGTATESNIKVLILQFATVCSVRVCDTFYFIFLKDVNNLVAVWTSFAQRQLCVFFFFFFCGGGGRPKTHSKSTYHSLDPEEIIWKPRTFCREPLPKSCHRNGTARHNFITNVVVSLFLFWKFMFWNQAKFYRSCSIQKHNEVAFSLTSLSSKKVNFCTFIFKARKEMWLKY